MAERKVLKYYSPDLDPSKLPRARRPKNQQMKVRSMLPMSIRCNACGNYICEEIIYTYKGIRMHRFYFKCTKCSAEMTIKTDLQNSDYEVEKDKQKRKSQGMGDAMKSLENRTLDSKREALQQGTAAEKENKIEEALVKSIFQKPKEVVPRITDEDPTRLSSGNEGLKRRKVLPDDSRSKEGPSGSGSHLVKAPSKPSAIIFLLKQKPEKKQEETGLLSLQQNYAESDD
ncbi:hypothetical protein ES332_D02G013700v1 [Gossypium tomentosum]|uniref:Splicing factor YJU2 n=1 Tax=Gossypium tomentosum TaxID=34277 RepID=A0A5D2LQT5_GOSTO|nr:hypothetical protein ES332_D02G013700v1 [Gossypium tomentosum]